MNPARCFQYRPLGIVGGGLCYRARDHGQQNFHSRPDGGPNHPRRGYAGRHQGGGVFPHCGRPLEPCRWKLERPLAGPPAREERCRHGMARMSDFHGPAQLCGAGPNERIVWLQHGGLSSAYLTARYGLPEVAALGVLGMGSARDEGDFISVTGRPVSTPSAASPRMGGISRCGGGQHVLWAVGAKLYAAPSGQRLQQLVTSPRGAAGAQ